MQDFIDLIAKTATRLGRGSLRILIAEDYSDLARIMVMYLKHMGFDVQSVATGPQVLPKVRRFLPHLVLLDIGLPGMNGYEVAAAIRADPAIAKTVIIAISAYDLETGTEPYLAARFNHYCTKPVNLDNLVPMMLSCWN